MQWVDIKRKYPDKFILIDDIVEEEINGSAVAKELRSSANLH